ncbi:GntR family transcriptional regulator [Brachybacterium sp. GPGPB12]|uniref:GntR family transcriptional regulator n=1 Tax=Brachybacterium sp. GPGPB12 TaxID=3023517 RepID=UPI003134304E
MPSPTLPWLDDRENRPIATQIAAATARRIAEGAIDPGALSREVDVAEEHGASRTPAREAMLQLETWGLVRLLPKKGAQVTTPTAREREESLSVRAMLEGHAVSRITPDETRRISLVEALAPVLTAQEAATDRPADFAVHDYAFHLTLASHDGNRVVEEGRARSDRDCSASRIWQSSPPPPTCPPCTASTSSSPMRWRAGTSPASAR